MDRKKKVLMARSLVLSIHEHSKNASPALENLPHLDPHFRMTLAVLLVGQDRRWAIGFLPLRLGSLLLTPSPGFGLAGAPRLGWAGSKPKPGPVPAFVPLSALGSVAPLTPTPLAY